MTAGRRRLDLWFAVSAAALSLLAAVLVLRLWEANLRVPMAYGGVSNAYPGGDANAYGAVVKGIVDHGWYLENAQLGAPFGQQLYDYPIDSTATGPVLAVELLGLPGLSYAPVVNLFFLLTFPVVAVVAFLVLKSLGLSRPVSLVCAVLYSLAPYHFFRGEGHLYLSAYYVAPVAAYLMLRVLGHEPLLDGWKSRRTWATVALCVVVGTGGLYYAAFSVLLLLAASIVVLAVRRSLRAGAAGGILAAAIALVVLCQQVPTIVHDLRHGRVRTATTREPAESDVFGLRVAQLVLPLPEHRISFLGRAARHYRATAPLPSEAGPTLGAAATVGFVWLLLVAVSAAAGPAFRRPRDDLPAWAAAALLIAVLLAATGGVPTLIAYLVTPEIRVWSRMSIFIAFFALIGLGVLLDRAGSLLTTRRGGLALFGAVLAGVVVLGVADQTSNAFVPRYRELEGSFRSDAGFVGAIERSLPHGAMVYQLPYQPFPEVVAPPAPPFFDYDMYRGYLHSRDLRWSYGVLKGSVTDWASQLVQYPLERTLPGLTAAGFDGIYIDRFAYPDRGAALEQTLSGALRERPLVSADGRLSFFDLRDYAADERRRLPPVRIAALRSATLMPARIEWGADVWPQEHDAEQQWRWTRGPSAVLRLTNSDRAAQRVRFSAMIDTVGGPVRVTIRYPDGTSTTVRAGQTGTPISHLLVLPPGSRVLHLESDAPPVRPPPPDPRSTIGFRIVDPVLAPTVFGLTR
jgi:phosphoglycerol transferase